MRICFPVKPRPCRRCSNWPPCRDSRRAAATSCPFADTIAHLALPDPSADGAADQHHGRRHGSRPGRRPRGQRCPHSARSPMSPRELDSGSYTVAQLAQLAASCQSWRTHPGAHRQRHVTARGGHAAGHRGRRQLAGALWGRPAQPDHHRHQRPQHSLRRRRGRAGGDSRPEPGRLHACRIRYRTGNQRRRRFDLPSRLPVDHRHLGHALPSRWQTCWIRPCTSRRAAPRRRRN